MVIASDGVWEFLTNEMVARIVWPFYIKNSPEQAGNAIVRAAAQKWKENDTVIDDITCITIFLEVEWIQNRLDKIEPWTMTENKNEDSVSSAKVNTKFESNHGLSRPWLLLRFEKT